MRSQPLPGEASRRRSILGVVYQPAIVAMDDGGEGIGDALDHGSHERIALAWPLRGTLGSPGWSEGDPPHWPKGWAWGNRVCAASRTPLRICGGS
jgi:hypothetical protein